MLAPLPPYAVAPPAFPFPALARLAGRAPLGGPREALLACYMAARLAHGALETPGGSVPPSLRLARGRGARAWLGALAVPPAVRAPVAKLIDASTSNDPVALRPPLAAVIAVTAGYLDGPARSELDHLTQALAG
ncbi:MAG: hypothetical protein KGN74_09395 [Gemmatimonadota bacterium]|nr:hypothetical protein [Gemmatimonadota bacterium]